MPVKVTIVDSSDSEVIGKSWITDDDGTHHSDLEAQPSLAQISAINRSRAARWHAEGEPWSAADWSNALAGETGELCNVIKKIRRHETGASTDYNTPELGELVDMVADEIADVFLYLDLVANYFDLDLYECLVPKFNRVSEAQRFPERLS